MKRVDPIAALRGTLRSVSAVVRSLRADGSASGRSYAITLLTPIRPGAEAQLAAHIDALGSREFSPLAKLPSVHFGRWVVIDQLKTAWRGAPVPAPRLKSAYLLFTACVTFPEADDPTPRLPAAFLKELLEAIPTEAHAIWGHCLNYPGADHADQCVSYLASCQLETSLFYVGYANVTPEEVRHALSVRDEFTTFVRAHQGDLDAAALQQSYLQESGTWLRSG